MATSTISNTVKDSAGNPVPGVVVIIDAVPGPAYRNTDGSELAAVTSLVTDVTGLWSTALERTSNIDPPGTYYRVKEYIPKTKGGTRVWFFTVPNSNGLLHDNLVTPSVADAIIRPTVVTSSTRPTSPFVGQAIFETDTGNVLYYYGSTLLWQPNWALPWGQIGYDDLNTDFTTSATSPTDVTGLSATFTRINNRRYEAILNANCDLTAGPTSLTIVLADGSNTVLDQKLVNTGAAAFAIPTELTARITGSGSFTAKARLNAGVGTATAALRNTSTKLSTIRINDIGPAGLPVIT